MEKTLLKVAAGINLVLGGIIFLISSFVFFALGGWGVIAIPFFVIAGYQFLLGGLFFGGADNIDKNIKTARVFALTGSILSILTGHMVSFILGIIAFANMLQKDTTSQPKPEKTDEEKAERRLRILLALGCGLVILAGIIFAMTTWETLSGFGKTLALIIASVIFFIMSFLAENKFNIKRSSVTYYILANVFAVFAFIAAGYFNIFGEWFSLNGEGAHLYQAFLWGIGGILTFLAYFKYEANDIFYLLDLCVLMFILSLVKFANLGQDVWIFVAVAILSLFTLIQGKNSNILKAANKFALVLLPIASVILVELISLLTKSDRLIFYLLAFACAFIASYYNAVKNKNLFYEIFAPIFTLATAFIFTAVIGVDSKIILLQLLVISLLVYAVGYSKREEKALFSSTNLAVDFGLLYVVLDALNLNFNYFSLVGAVILLGISVLASLKGNVGKYYFENLLEPLKVILLSYTIYRLFYTFDYTEETLFLALVGLIFAVICLFRKETMKMLYFVGGVIVTVLAMFPNISEFAPVSQLLGVMALAILLIITFSHKDERFKGNKELIYGLELLALALFVLNTFIHFDLKLVGIILLTFIYTILFIMSNKNSIFRCFTIVALLIPYVIILPISIWNDNVNYILYSLPWLALIFIYTRGFLSSVNNKKVNWIEVVLLCIWYMQVGSKICLEVALFIGIISFASILVGYKSDKWLSLYVTGIIFLILNIIVQLKEFWEMLPIWVYILIAGLVLIGIVTYSEYKKANKKLDAEKVEPEVVSTPHSTDIWHPVDRKAIVAGTILYIIVIPILLEIIGK